MRQNKSLIINICCTLINFICFLIVLNSEFLFVKIFNFILFLIQLVLLTKTIKDRIKNNQ